MNFSTKVPCMFQVILKKKKREKEKFSNLLLLEFCITYDVSFINVIHLTGKQLIRDPIGNIWAFGWRISTAICTPTRTVRAAYDYISIQVMKVIFFGSYFLKLLTYLVYRNRYWTRIVLLLYILLDTTLYNIISIDNLVLSF